MTDLLHLIEERRSSGVSLGTIEQAPSGEWLSKAEQRLGLQLPPSYKWFLRNYGGGEIAGEEIYSIYEMEFETVLGGDIVFQYLAHQRSQTLLEDEIPLAQTDAGEVFCFKASQPDADGEYPVYVKRGNQRQLYAKTFAEFLTKRIQELC